MNQLGRPSDTGRIPGEKGVLDAQKTQLDKEKHIGRMMLVIVFMRSVNYGISVNRKTKVR